MRKQLLVVLIACASFAASAELRLAGIEGGGNNKVFVSTESIKKVDGGKILVEMEWTMVSSLAGYTKSNMLLKVDCKNRMAQNLRMTIYSDDNDWGKVTSQYTEPREPYGIPGRNSAVDIAFDYVCNR